jgi:hypothetical protein
MVKYLLDEVLVARPPGSPTEVRASVPVVVVRSKEQEIVNIDDMGADDLIRMFEVSDGVAGALPEVNRDE